MRFFLGTRVGKASVGFSVSGSSLGKAISLLFLWPFYLYYYIFKFIFLTIKKIVNLIASLIKKRENIEEESSGQATLQTALPKSKASSEHIEELSMTYEILSGNSRKFYLSAINEPYVVLDLETTGFSRKNDRIIELSMIRCEKGRTTRYETFVNPGISIPARVAKLTGISDDDVADAPQIEDILESVYEFIGDCKIVAHNASFDAGFICHAFSRAGIDGTLQFYDTLKLARAAFPEFENHKLSTLIDELGLMDGPQTHRAMDDAECTRKLFNLCIDRLLEDKERELAAKRAKRAAASVAVDRASQTVDVKTDRRTLDQQVDDILSDLSWLD